MNRDILAEWPLPDSRLIVEFDDGELETTVRRTALSWFLWEVHRRFPNTPLNVRHHIGNVFPSADLVPKVLSRIAEDLHYTYHPINHGGFRRMEDETYDRLALWHAIKDVGQNIFNHLGIMLEEWMVAIDASHIDELFHYPPIVEIRENINPTQLSISDAYDRATEILMKDPKLIHNPIVMGLRSRQIKITQFLQILICRGFLTDADQHLFRRPITVGYYQGLTKLHDIMIDSCSAKKALSFTKKPLRIVEYFNRKMQLSTTVVDKLVWHDCGSTMYAEMHIDAKTLPTVEGAYYVTPTGLQVVRADDKHLIGKTIKMRNAMFCRHRGEGSVCHVCFGELAWSVPPGTSLGHVSSTELCREGSQRTMSIKHFDGSSVIEAIRIPADFEPYIQVCVIDDNFLTNQEEDAVTPQTARESSMLRFNPRIRKMNPMLILSSSPGKATDNASSLTTIRPDTDISRINVHRFTSFKEVRIQVTNLRGEVDDVWIGVSQGPRLASLSKSMLRHIQSAGYTVDENGDIVIDLQGWDFSLPVFSLPRRHASTLDFMSSVEVFVRSPTKKVDRGDFTGRTLTQYSDPVEALVDFSDLVNSQLNVNIAHLSVILLSMMRPADDPDDYRLPDIDRPAMFEEHRTLMQYRSMGQLMAYERQPDVIEDPDSYLITKRPAGLLDPFIYPEVI